MPHQPSYDIWRKLKNSAAHVSMNDANRRADDVFRRSSYSTGIGQPGSHSVPDNGPQPLRDEGGSIAQVIVPIVLLVGLAIIAIWLAYNVLLPFMVGGAT